jgi:hypothetical protein
MPDKAYRVAAKLSFTIVTLTLLWLALKVIGLVLAIAFLCAILPAIWSNQPTSRRRVRAALSGIGVAFIIYLCMFGIVAGLMTWSHEAAWNAALALQLLMFFAAFWVSRQILRTTPDQSPVQFQ